MKLRTAFMLDSVHISMFNYIRDLGHNPCCYQVHKSQQSDTDVMPHNGWKGKKVKLWFTQILRVSSSRQHTMFAGFARPTWLCCTICDIVCRFRLLANYNLLIILGSSPLSLSQSGKNKRVYNWSIARKDVGFCLT